MSNWYNQDADKTLSDNEAHIWLNFLNLHQAKLKHLYPLLSPAEKERSEQFKHFKQRKNYIASHGFLHTVLSYYIDTAAEDIRFSMEEKGKPFILAEQNNQQIQFNLSHSGNLALLAVCRTHPVGIDIECIDRKSDYQGIARRFFTDNEQQAFFKLPEDQQKDAFYQVWTRKEAHMKVTGQGLSLAPTQFEVSVPPDEPAFIQNLKTPDSNQYYMSTVELPDMYSNYHACLSTEFPFESVKCFIHA